MVWLNLNELFFVSGGRCVCYDAYDIFTKSHVQITNEATCVARCCLNPKFSQSYYELDGNKKKCPNMERRRGLRSDPDLAPAYQVL